jgi:hypothetical protein
MENKMKKIISMILAISLVLVFGLALVSCKDKEEEKTIYDLASELNPTRVVTLAEYTDASGEKLIGEYDMQRNGGDYIFTFSYDRYRTAEEAIAEGIADPIKTVEGAVYCQGGKYSGDAVVWGASPVATEIKLNLKEEYLTSPTVSDDGRVLTASLTKENAVNALGTSLSAAGNIDIKVESNGTYLTNITVTCTTESGAALVIRTSYSYNALTLVFPDAEG